ncbi:hypothetical protein [Oryzihumus leptocrescens]|uniref:Uncharacterized protein n=1 Tax=Oryzihumus leptocrescens TaxID=297536 RepID=A0A542ZFT7_9MICO|nr:hypothetical protein [Oryzihumus leptocrescens]TQL59208.1 hypothetical protein FB474_0556 [Oryzihumus leptocrescens]
MSPTAHIDEPNTIFREKLGAVAPGAHIDSRSGVIKLTSWSGHSLEPAVMVHLDRGALAGAVWAREAAAQPLWPQARPTEAGVNLLLEQIADAVGSVTDTQRHVHVSTDDVVLTTRAARP